MLLHDKENDRIIFIRSNADANYWDNLWNEKKDWIENYTKKVSVNNPFLRLFDKYLPKGARILEAGCGRGQFVYGLTKKGFECVGVDYAEKTVKILNESIPELDIRMGDITNLVNVESESFDAYYSGGVIEHFWDGYDNIIKEANRVLKKGGKLFITFPFMSASRERIKNGLKVWDKPQQPDNFYQFALKLSAATKDIEQNGFKLIYQHKRNGLKGYIEANPNSKLATSLYNYKKSSTIIRGLRYIVGIGLAKFGFGHTVELIFEKL